MQEDHTAALIVCGEDWLHRFHSRYSFLDTPSFGCQAYRWRSLFGLEGRRADFARVVSCPAGWRGDVRGTFRRMNWRATSSAGTPPVERRLRFESWTPRRARASSNASRISAHELSLTPTTSLRSSGR